MTVTIPLNQLSAAAALAAGAALFMNAEWVRRALDDNLDAAH